MVEEMVVHTSTVYRNYREVPRMASPFLFYGNVMKKSDNIVYLFKKFSSECAIIINSRKEEFAV